MIEGNYECAFAGLSNKILLTYCVLYAAVLSTVGNYINHYNLSK